MGRACNSRKSCPSHAHSTSCGEPAFAPTCRTIRANSTACSSLSAGTSTEDLVESRMRPSVEISHRSGFTNPAATTSPKPCVASMITTSSPEIGSAENATPAARASTIRCTTTAIETSKMLLCCLMYSLTRGFNIDAQHARTVFTTSFASSMFRCVSS